MTMTWTPKALAKRAGKLGLVLLVLNEIRGVAVVGTILWGWIKANGA